jgi:rod shape-determining protein MreD
MPILYTSGEQVEVYRFNLPTAILVPAAALFLQVFVPLRFPWFKMFDMPLLVVIFFGVARRNQIAGLMTGAIIGLIQDSLTPHPIGLYGIAKTVVGYGASSLGVRIDVENVGARFLGTMLFYLLHEGIYFVVARGMVQVNLQWSWGHESLAALANGLLAVPLFALLDRLKQRT